MYLALLYLHTAHTNPSKEDVFDDPDGFRIWEIEDPTAVFYGDIQSIKEWVESHPDIGYFANAFLIIDSELYYIEKNVRVIGL